MKLEIPSKFRNLAFNSCSLCASTSDTTKRLGNFVAPHKVPEIRIMRGGEIGPKDSADSLIEERTNFSRQEQGLVGLAIACSVSFVQKVS